MRAEPPLDAASTDHSGTAKYTLNNWKNMNTSILRAACAAIVFSTLAGCSSSPGDADARAAMLKDQEALNGGPISKENREEIEQAKVVGCAKAEAGGHKCDVANARGAVVSVRFVKTDSGWAVARGN